ncbi:MAG: flavodoxin family protein [Dehalococcoidia bacterium]
MLKVLGLAASPRRGGNTDLLLEQALAGARGDGAVTEKLLLNDLDIGPCQHCDGCLYTGECIVVDDMQAIHGQLRDADRIVLASPIFFMGLTAQAKAMIDRCQALWVEKFILKVRRTQDRDGGRRRGLFIAVGGMERPDLFDPARATVKAFFATCDVAYGEELLYPGIDLSRAIIGHASAMKEAFEAGARLVAPPDPAPPL